MATLPISDELMNKLRQLAERKNSSLEEALETAIEQSLEQPDEPMLARSNDPFEAFVGIVKSGQNDVAARSRETLDSEFASHL